MAETSAEPKTVTQCSLCKQSGKRKLTKGRRGITLSGEHGAKMMLISAPDEPICESAEACVGAVVKRLATGVAALENAAERRLEEERKANEKGKTTYIGTARVIQGKKMEPAVASAKKVRGKAHRGG